MKTVDKLSPIQSFQVFYGKVLTQNFKGDLLVLEPKGVSQNTLNDLKDKGKMVLSYFSVVETGEWDPNFSTYQEEDFLKIKGRIVKNEAFGNCFLDLSRKKVQKILYQKACDLLTQYHGLFLDTLGNLDFWDLPQSVREEQAKGAALLLSELKKSHPQAVFIQNNGFLEVWKYTAPYLEGICFENPPKGSQENNLFTKKAFKQLSKIIKQFPIRIFILEEEPNKKNLKTWSFQILFRCFLKAKGYLYYPGRRNYL